MHQITKLPKYDVNIDRIEGRNRQFYTNSWKFQCTIIMDRISRQKINIEIEDLNGTINQLDLGYICITLQPTTEYHCFQAYIEHFLGMNIC